jgi:hypothetical protein
LRTAVTAKCVSATPGTLERKYLSAPGTLQGNPKCPGKKVLECPGYPGKAGKAVPSTLESNSQVPWSRKAKYPGKHFPSTLEQKGQVPWKAIPKYPGKGIPSVCILSGNKIEVEEATVGG